MKRNKAIELIGWLGVLLILTAYILNSLQIISSSDYLYSLLNLLGAIGIIIDALKDKNYQPVFLNIVWGIIAIVALIKAFI